MTDSASIDATRRSALALLADGNGVESVAHVLDVPVDVVATWQRGEHVAWSAAVPTSTPTTPTTSHGRIHDVDVVHAAPAGERQLTLGAGLFVVALALTSGLALALLHRPDVFSEMWLACVPLAGTGVSLAVQARALRLREDGEGGAARLVHAAPRLRGCRANDGRGRHRQRRQGREDEGASRDDRVEVHDAPSLSLFIADTGPKPRAFWRQVNDSRD